MTRDLVACRRRCGRAVPNTALHTCDRCWLDLSQKLRAGIRRCQVWLDTHPGDPQATRVLEVLLTEADREFASLPDSPRETAFIK